MAHVRKMRRRGKTVCLVDYFDPENRRHRAQFATREKAEEHLADAIKKAKQSGPVIDDPEITLTDYRKRWTRRAESELTPRTFAHYAYYFGRYVEPEVGRLKVRTINRGVVRDLLATTRGKGLAKNTVRLRARRCPWC